MPKHDLELRFYSEEPMFARGVLAGPHGWIVASLVSDYSVVERDPLWAGIPPAGREISFAWIALAVPYTERWPAAADLFAFDARRGTIAGQELLEAAHRGAGRRVRAGRFPWGRERPVPWVFAAFMVAGQDLLADLAGERP